VRAGARLMREGPYRVLRHPMYTALLLVMAGFAATAPTVARLLLWAALCCDLVAKLSYEERLLARAFPEYAAYRESTWRLIPFVF